MVEEGGEPLEDRNWQIIDDWMRQYGDRIIRVVYLIIDDYHLAEEITQEVFVRAYNSLDSFRSESSAYTWLYRIALNLTRNYLNRKFKIRFLPLADEERADLISEPLEEKAIRLSISQSIRKCIRKLPEIYREVIILHYFEEMKVTEIAQVLQQSEGTVKSRLSRGRESLENMMRKEGLEYGGQRFL